jgi:D-cysteine desulfhydrase family pyridoxal phosphate-dependent enzyme
VIKKFLGKFPKYKIIDYPTPLEKLSNITNKYKGPNVFIKRDDCTTLALGGNKTRKLEYIMGHVNEKKYDEIITLGGLQSNWVRQTISISKKMGLKVIALYEGHEPENIQGNLLLDKLMGTEMKFIGPISQEEEDKEIRGEGPYTLKVAREEKEKGYNPYIAPLGGSIPLGHLGYIDAVLELNNQFKSLGRSLDKIIVATGSGGTQAGLELGVRLLELKTKVLGISISRHTREKSEEISEMCNETLKYLDINDEKFTPEQIFVDYESVGEGYAIPSKECINAIYEIASEEGIILDPVYTGKAMAGMIKLLKNNFFKKGENIVFIHTGGAPANFAYNDIFI